MKKEPILYSYSTSTQVGFFYSVRSAWQDYLYWVQEWSNNNNLQEGKQTSTTILLLRIASYTTWSTGTSTVRYMYAVRRTRIIPVFAGGIFYIK